MGHVVLRDEFAADLRNLEFVRFAHIEEKKVIVVDFLLVQPGLQLSYRDLGDSVLHLGRLRRFGRDSAELVVVDQFGHGGVGAAHRAVGILAQLELSKPHGQRVDKKQTADEWLTFTEDELDDFRRLDDADETGQDAENTALGAAGNEARRGRLGIEAAVARTFFCREDRSLAFKAEDAAVGVWFLQQNAGIIDQVAGLEVVCAVGNDVVLGEDFKRIGARQHGVVLDDVERGVERVELLLRGVDLLASNILGRVNDLALQIAGVDHVKVDEAQSANSRCGQVESQRRAEAACADAKDFGGLEALLALHADLGQDQMAGVASEFVVCEFRQSLGFGGCSGHWGSLSFV